VAVEDLEAVSVANSMLTAGASGGAPSFRLAAIPETTERYLDAPSQTFWRRLRATIQRLPE